MAARIPIQKTEHSEELDKLVGAWFSAAKALTSAQIAETDARMALFRHFYKEGEAKSNEPGKEKFAMPGGWVLEIERRENVKVDEAVLDVVKKAIHELPVDPETGEQATIDACIKYKPQFSDSGYRSLREDVRKLLANALTFTPGKPAISLEQKGSGN